MVIFTSPIEIVMLAEGYDIRKLILPPSKEPLFEAELSDYIIDLSLLRPKMHVFSGTVVSGSGVVQFASIGTGANLTIQYRKA